MAESGPLKRLKKGNAPKGLRIAIAEGLVPLEAHELIEALSILVFDPDERVSTALRENFPALPRPLLEQISKDPSIESHFLDFIVETMGEDEEILTNIILNKSVENSTLDKIASDAPINVLTLLANNKQRIVNHPPLLNILLKNEQLPRVTRYSLLEFKANNQDIFDHEIDSKNFPSTSDTTTAEIPDSRKDKEMDRGLDETDEYSIPVKDFLAGEEPEKQSSSDSDDMMEGWIDSDLTDEKLADEIPDGNTRQDETNKTSASMDGWNMNDLTADTDISDIQENEDDSIEFAFDGEEMPFDLTKDEDSGDDDDLDDGWADIEFETDYDDDDLDDDFDEDDEEEKIVDTRMRLLKMNASEKMIIAAMGTKQERMILVRDSNKKVAVAVVDGPKMTEFEIQMIAQNRSVCEEVLKAIGDNREWGKLPNIKKALVMNPKTPMGMSLKMLNTLSDMYLKEVMKSKEIPYGLAAAAKRLHGIREARRNRAKK